MRYLACLLGTLLLISDLTVAAESNATDRTLYPVALMDFSDKGLALRGTGEKVSNIIFTSLSASDDVSLVERKALQQVLDEAALNLSGMVNPAQATRIGHLTGAQMIVTGTLFELDDRLMITAKVIGVETGRVVGTSVEGELDESLVELSQQIAKKIELLVREKRSQLVAPTQRPYDESRQALRVRLAGKDKPSLVVDISERHINRIATESASENVLLLYGTELGFEVVDKGSDQAVQADVMIIGQGFSEYGSHMGELVGVKARLEVKAVDQRSGKILVVDRQSEMEVDVSEITAAKNALSRAAEKIAQRMLPKLVKK